jgi:hypothetical protein
MAQRAESAADTTRSALAFAKAMTIGLRSWGFYPPEHPAVGVAVDRLIATTTDACAGGMMQLAVTPHALLLDGLPLDSTYLAVVECAELLHDRDILQLTIAAPATDAVMRSLLAVLSLDRETRRARGGPAAIWGAEDQTSILIEQIDYQEILEREIDEGPAPPGSRSARSSWATRRSRPPSSNACSKSPATWAPSASCARTPKSRSACPTARRC